MKLNQRLNMRCIDISSRYCPCLLAETNHCISCSHLGGQQLCDCDWTGTCVQYEKHWQSKDRSKGCGDSISRIEIETEILKRELIAKHTYLLQFSVSQVLAEGLNRAGAFVFLRKPYDPEFYNFPVGIMKVLADNMIQVVVEAVGPKSTRVIEGDNSLLVRGPYYNGIFGQPWIDNINCGKILLVSGGMGQPPAVPIAGALMKTNNKVTAILAPGKISKVFIDQDLHSLGAEVHVVPSLRLAGLQMVAELFGDIDKQPDLVVSAGPDEQHHGIIDTMRKAGVNIPMAATNNSTMCCGEGICGSCQRETYDNKVICTCKVQTDFAQLIHH